MAGWCCCCPSISFGFDEDFSDPESQWYGSPYFWPDPAINNWWDRNWQADYTSGSWFHPSGHLYELSGTGRMINVVPMTKWQTAMITIESAMEAGDSYSLYFNWHSDGSYMEIRQDVLGGGLSNISLYSVSGGVETLLQRCENTFTVPSFSVCMSNHYIIALGILVINDGIDGSEYVGFGHVTGHLVEYASFVAAKTDAPEALVYECGICGFCRCLNDDEEEVVVPRMLQATIIGYGDCDNLTGYTWDIDTGIPCPTRSQVTNRVNQGCFTNTGAKSLLTNILCGTDELTQPTNPRLASWQLFWNAEAIGSQFDLDCMFGAHRDVPLLSTLTESSCDPFILVFEYNYTLDNSDSDAAIPGPCPGQDNPPPEWPDSPNECDPCGKMCPPNTVCQIHFKIVVTPK